MVNQKKILSGLPKVFTFSAYFSEYAEKVLPLSKTDDDKLQHAFHKTLKQHVRTINEVRLTSGEWVRFQFSSYEKIEDKGPVILGFY